MIVKNDPVFKRRRRVALLALLAVVFVLVFGIVKVVAGSAEAAPGGGRTRSVAPVSTPSGVSAPTPSPAVAQGVAGPPAQTMPVRILRLSGGITPKSVVASSRGQVFAQSMMYTHTVSVFGADGAKLTTIKDAVELAKFGVAGHPGPSKGSPVEAAFSPDGRRAWVTNYEMYGSGFRGSGSDSCTNGTGQSRSFVYEIDTTTYAVTRVVEVGVVPKYVAVTPDGAKVLVTNWCSMDLTVIDVHTAKVVASIPIGGQHPRGIAVSPDSTTAYVAVMDSGRIVAVDLRSNTVARFADVGGQPRHLVLSPDGRRLYVTNNRTGTVSELSTETAETLRTAKVGGQPRSMAISPDGGALYVVNYRSASMSKIRTADLKVIATEPTDANPVGITYEPTRKAVWVACYGGTILVFDDSRLAPPR